MKKLIIFIIILNILLLSSIIGVNGEYYNNRLENMRSKAFFLINTDTDSVVFAQNENMPLKCASLVKTATACLVVEKCQNLDETVTVTASALNPLKGLNSASSDLKEGEVMSVRNLLYCMMLENSNDVANVLAEYIGGSIDAFVVQMNEFAKSIGCKNTNFTNPHGLDEEGEYSTAYDMYLLTRYAMNNSILADMAATVEYTVPATNLSEARELNTRCDIVERGSRYYYDYAKGFKVGTTDEAGKCAAIVATKDAYTYIGVVLGASSICVDGCGYPDNTALYDARKMFRWAFRELKMTTIAEANDIMSDIKVTLSTEADHVRLIPEKQIQALLLDTVDDDSLEFVYDIPESVKAPIEKGQVIGSVEVKYADNVIAKANLVAGDSVKRNALLFIGYIIKNIVLSPVFLVILSIGLVCLCVAIFKNYAQYKKTQRGTRKRLRDIKEGKTTRDT